MIRNHTTGLMIYFNEEGHLGLFLTKEAHTRQITPLVPKRGLPRTT